MKLVS